MSTEEPGNGPRHEIGDIEHHLDVDAILGHVVQAGQIRGGIHLHPRTDPHTDGRAIPRQLPAAPRGFVNRISEVAELDALIDATGPGEPHPVVAIVGSGGVGKTALALHWAHRVRERFGDGELFVNLRGYDSSQPVPAAATLERMLRALGVSAAGIPAELEDRSALFRSLVAEREILIVLDNAASAGQVRPLIPGGAGPLLLVTSRNRMPSLAVRDGVGYVRADVLGEADAVDLIETVTGISRTGDSRVEVSELVRLCARLPLALRIAAERAVSHPCMDLSELIADLRDASGLWEALSVEDGADAEDVRTVFTWSYRSLRESAAWVFRVMGLHPGADISLPALAAAAGVSLREARRATDVLIGAYLVEPTAGSRYQMHDLLRAFAIAESHTQDSAEELQGVLDRMCCWYAASVDSAAEVAAAGNRLLPGNPAAPGMSALTFATAEEALAWFDTERQNLLAAARLAEASSMPRSAFSIALSVSAIYMSYFNFDDWSEASLIGLRAAATGGSRDLAVARRNRGMYLYRRGDYLEARETLAEAQRGYEETGDRHGAAMAMHARGLVDLRTRRIECAAEQFASAAAVFAELDDRRQLCGCRLDLAWARIELGAIASALDDLRSAEPLIGEFDGSQLQCYAWNLRAQAHRHDGDLDGAKTAIDRALMIAEALQSKVEEGFTLLEMSRIHLELGEASEAMECCQVAAALLRKIGVKRGEAEALQCTGEVLLHLERAEEASGFYLQAARQFSELGEPWNEAASRLGAADARARLEQPEAEREQLERAAVCLGAFSDPRATAMRRQIQHRLE